MTIIFLTHLVFPQQLEERFFNFVL